MIDCTFRLNAGGLSTLSCPGTGYFTAFSGNAGPHRNNPDSSSVMDTGPLPPGRYYIVDRPRSGMLGPIRDLANSIATGSNRDLWFGLYRDDGKFDDVTYIDGVMRGAFRLHPAGYRGISNGCITLVSHYDYSVLFNALMATHTFSLWGMKIYGKVHVY